MQLAGTEGAKIRDSFAAKAGALRARPLAEAEARATSATERMSLPVVLLAVGFLIFLAFPASPTSSPACDHHTPPAACKENSDARPPVGPGPPRARPDHHLARPGRPRRRGPARDDSGYTTETVIVTSLLAALALAVIAIIVAKVTGLANALNV